MISMGEFEGNVFIGLYKLTRKQALWEYHINLEMYEKMILL